MTHHPRRKILNWPELPPELLAEISDHLDSPANIKNFRATCQSFRSSTPPPPLRLSPGFPEKFSFIAPPFFLDGAPFTVIPITVFLLRVPAVSDTVSWLVAVEEVNSGRLRMMDPFSKLPVDSPGSLSGFEAVEVSTGFALRFGDGNIPVLEHANSFSPKVVVCHNLGGRYLILLHSTGVLECVSLQSGATNLVSHEEVSRFDDIVCRNDTVLAVDRFGRLYAVEYSLRNNFGLLMHIDIPPFNNMKITQLVETAVLIPGKSLRRKRLLWDSNGEAYLVVRETVYVDCKFHVFKLNYELCVWEEVVSLGDRVLFVTVDDCFFAWASDLRLSGIRGNCIVFPKYCFPDGRGLNFADEGLFRGVSERDAVGVCRYGEGQDFTLISSLRGYSDLLRPFSSCILNGRLSYLRVSANDKVDEKQEVQMQCVTDASSRAGLIKDYASADDGYYVDEVGTEIQDHYGHEINFSFETPAGELSVQINDQDQHSADMSGNLVIIYALEARAKEPSTQINVQDQHSADMSGNLVIICALEAQAKEQSAQINVEKDQYSIELAWNRGIISVEEAQPGEPPRIYSDSSLVVNPADEETMDAGSSTRD